MVLYSILILAFAQRRRQVALVCLYSVYYIFGILQALDVVLGIIHGTFEGFRVLFLRFRRWIDRLWVAAAAHVVGFSFCVLIVILFILH